MLKNWTLTVNDDGVIILPDDLLTDLGWNEGDTLKWIDNHNGSWSIVKEEDLTNFIKKGIISDE